MRRVLAVGLLTLGLSGCADTHTIRQVSQPAAKLPGASSFYVAVPADGKFSRTTGWSGRPDAVEMSVDVVELAAGTVVASSSIGGKSRWATMSNDKPEDLLPEPVSDHVASLF